MTTPGPKPKPDRVHYLNGNPSKKPLTGLLDGFQPDAELPECPKHLHDEASAEYRRLGEQLNRYHMVSQLDRGVLAMAAVEWARHVWAESKIAATNAVDPNGEAGLVDVTPNGFKQMSVYLIISRKAMELYLKFCTEFGLTPSSRTRVTPANPQLQLPGLASSDDEVGAPKLTLACFR